MKLSYVVFSSIVGLAMNSPVHADGFSCKRELYDYRYREKITEIIDLNQTGQIYSYVFTRIRPTAGGSPDAEHITLGTELSCNRLPNPLLTFCAKHTGNLESIEVRSNIVKETSVENLEGTNYEHTNEKVVVTIERVGLFWPTWISDFNVYKLEFQLSDCNPK